MNEIVISGLDSFFEFLSDIKEKTGSAPVVLPELYPNKEEASRTLKKLPAGSVARFVFVPETVNSERLENTESRIKDVTDKIKEAESDAYFKDFKADNITCKACGSHVNKEYINTYLCPVCGNDMRPKSEFDRINGLKKSLENLNAKKQTEINNLIEKGTCIKYLVSEINKE